MTGTSTAEQLGIQPAQSVLVINPPGDYDELIGGLPPGTTLTIHRPADVVHAFAGNRDELSDRAQVAVASVLEDGLVWISYPADGRSDIDQEALSTAIDGWRPSDQQLTINGDWSAVRLQRQDGAGSGGAG